MRSFYPAAKVKRLVAVAAVASVVTSFVVLTGNPSFVRFRMSDVAASDPAKVAESFEARRGRLEAVCDTYKDPFRPESSVLGSSIPTSSISDYNYFTLNNTVYMTCAIHKVGSNSMHSFLNKIQNTVLERVRNATGSVPLSILVDDVITSGSESRLPVSESCWPECASRHRKVIVVRHPLERLLSAYRYVFDSSLEPPEVQHGAFFKDSETLQWTEFVENILRFGDAQWAEKQNIVGSHWEPFWRFCSVCHPQLMPDFVLKFENLRHDLKRFLDTLGLSEFSDVFPQSGVNKGGHSSEKIRQYYSKLSKATIRQLHQVYKLDHELFDYKPDSFIEYGFGN